MRFTIELIKKAWQIRKDASVELGCGIMDVSWKACLEIAVEELVKIKPTTVNYTVEQIGFGTRVQGMGGQKSWVAEITGTHPRYGGGKEQIMKKVSETEGKIREWMHDRIGNDQMAQYLTAEWGERFAIYADGSTATGQSVGDEIEEDERPVAWVKCPGIGNLDSSDFTSGWIVKQKEGRYWDDKGHEYDLAGVIRACCENGDMTTEIDQIIDNLIDVIERTRQ